MSTQPSVGEPPASAVAANRGVLNLIDAVDLNRFAIQPPAELARIDDELTCVVCDIALCAVDDGDSLAVLLRVAAGHLLICPG
ncbi:hypothetical protein AB0M43_34975 [Longispora sp. NPDC051575]|uniref:hypothetical protein n=1 Tax=Longispora sp. NPDC051575 TaxID=3154943 RepID=UPI00342AD072